MLCKWLSVASISVGPTGPRFLDSDKIFVRCPRDTPANTFASNCFPCFSVFRSFFFFSRAAFVPVALFFSYTRLCFSLRFYNLIIIIRFLHTRGRGLQLFWSIHLSFFVCSLLPEAQFRLASREIRLDVLFCHGGRAFPPFVLHFCLPVCLSVNRDSLYIYICVCVCEFLFFSVRFLCRNRVFFRCCDRKARRCHCEILCVCPVERAILFILSVCN